MSISDTYLASKDYEQTYRPTILYTVTLFNGTQVWFTTANDLTQVGWGASATYNGTQFQCSVKNQRIGALQSGSNLGTDVFGSVSVDLADPNGEWLNYELAFGFQGADMEARFALYDPVSNQFSPDSRILFHGMCDPATKNGDSLTITAVSTYALTKSITPPAPIQKECPWWFPTTFSQRVDGAYNPLSQFFQCGYGPDVGGFAEVGNLNGGSAFTSCAYTKTDCQSRGMYTSDSSSRQTSRFGGIQWTPPATWKGNSYTQGKTLQGVNSLNEQKWSQYVPLTFGTTWVNGVCANVVGDPNSTRAEVILGYGASSNYDAPSWTTQIPYVVVSGLLVPYQSQTSDLLFRWYGMTNGNRTGNVNPTAIYGSQGDPYGSMLTIMPIVYQQVAQSSTALNIRCLVSARPIPVYNPDRSFSQQDTDLLAWVLYEIIRMARPDLWAKINIQSVIDYAGICGQDINYLKADGTTGSHRRYGVALSIEKPQSTASIIEGLKIAGKVMIVPDPGGDGLIFRAKQTLGDQQPSPMPGSNYNTAVSSIDYTGNFKNGYVAYRFGDDNVIPGTVQMLQDPIAQTPVIFQAQIQDEDNSYTPDTVTVADVTAFNVIQQKNTATITALGLPNVDQAYRVLKTKQAETYCGNPRGDTKGTLRWKYKSTFRGAHLNLGDLIYFGSEKLNVSQTLYRVEGIAPDPDFKTATYALRFHQDIFYTDAYGQQ